MKQGPGVEQFSDEKELAGIWFLPRKTNMKVVEKGQRGRKAGRRGKRERWERRVSPGDRDRVTEDFCPHRMKFLGTGPE